MVMFANTAIEPKEIVDFLKHEIQLREICQRILYWQITRHAAQERNLVVTDEEIQEEANNQRYQRRLESADATYQWLADQLITPEDWEEGIRQKLLTHKLADHLFDKDVEKYFAEHRLDFEQVSLYRIRIPYLQLAQELFYQIEESEISFYEAAHLYDIDKNRRLRCGYEGKFYRWSLNPEVAAVLFSARLGEVIGPLECEKNYDLLVVDEFIAANLNPEIRQEIIDRLFKEWIDSEFNYLIHNT